MCLEAWGYTFNCDCFVLSTVWQVCCECLPQKPFCNISIQLSTSFRKLSSFQMVPQVNLKWAYCCLALHSLEKIHDFLATSHCKGPVDAIGGTMKRLVSLEVMSGKAEVITSSEFSLVTDRKVSIFCFKKPTKLRVIPTRSRMMIGMRSVMGEIQVPLPTRSRCLESLRLLHHSWLCAKPTK